MLTLLDTIDDGQKTIRLLSTPDGTQIRLTATLVPRLDMSQMDVDIYAHFRQNAEQPWELANDRPHPNWRDMSVQDYIDRGRSQLLQLLGSPGPLLSLSQHMRQRWHALSEPQHAQACYSVR